MTEKIQRNKVLNLLGLAKRAGRVITGEELVIKAIQAGRAKLVFLARNSSSNLTKKLQDKTSYYAVKCVDVYTDDELSQAIGSDRKVLAITDKGFAQQMEKLLMRD